MTDLHMTEPTYVELHKSNENTTVEAPAEIRNLPYYNKILTPHLGPECFERNPMRLAYLVSFFAVNALLVLAVVMLDLHWSLKIVCGLVIGACNAGATFVAHEMSHGSVIAGKKQQDFINLFAFSFFLIAPTYWRFWHDRLHHGNTQFILKDPDAFPNLMVFRQSKFMQRLFPWTPGSGTLRSYTYFFFWFSLQAFLNQIYFRFKNKMWEGLDNTRVTLEFSFQLLLAGTFLYLTGPSNWIYIFIIPIMVQNYTVMSYISTNHNMSPLTKVNDPLANSLSVTNSKFFEFIHLNFGYHTEHHIFPRMSCAHTKKVHVVLKKLFPDTYHCMSKMDALKHLYNTPRIYKNHTTLIHPKTMKTCKTI